MNRTSTKTVKVRFRLSRRLSHVQVISPDECPSGAPNACYLPTGGHQGTHAQLRHAPGLYRDLFEAQFRAETTPMV